jgi:hypothetical protein
VAAEFEGRTDIRQVRQPEGSEWCFAAIVSAVTKHQPIDEVHQALVADGISTADGNTLSPPEDREVQLAGDKILKLEPFVGFNTEALMTAINERFKARKAVALLHKKNDDELDDRNHWTLLTGRYHIDGETQLVFLMDPLQRRREAVEPSEVADMIERTIDFNGGAYACALSVEQAV